MSQELFIGLIAAAIAEAPQHPWKDSFKKVNLHPDHRVSFDVWVERISDKLAGEGACEKSFSLCDALPSVWKKMTTETRHKVVSIVDNCSQSGSDVWSNKPMMLQSCQCVSLDEMAKLRVCHMASKKDPSAFVGGFRSEEGNANESPTDHHVVSRKSPTDHFKWAQWNSPSAHDPHMKNKNDKKAQTECFTHMTNFVSRNHDATKNLLPSDGLDVEISPEQRKNLNPSVKECMMGCITDEVMGMGAKLKLIKRRVEMIEGNVASYSRILNDHDQVESLKNFKKVNAVVASIEEERATKREAAQKEKRKKGRERRKPQLTNFRKTEPMPFQH